MHSEAFKMQGSVTLTELILLFMGGLSSWDFVYPY